jgi:hypothetical protein
MTFLNLAATEDTEFTEKLPAQAISSLSLRDLGELGG